MILCYAICIFVYNLLLPNSLNRSNMHSENTLYHPKSRDLKINLRPNNGKSKKISASWDEELGRRARTRRILGSENTLIWKRWLHLCTSVWTHGMNKTRSECYYKLWTLVEDMSTKVRWLYKQTSLLGGILTVEGLSLCRGSRYRGNLCNFLSIFLWTYNCYKNKILKNLIQLFFLNYIFLEFQE